MERIPRGPYSVVIAHSLELLPPTISARIKGTQFFCGVDPVWAGLHSWETSEDGRSYRNTACFLEQRQVADRHPTIALPAPVEPELIIHELGHALHAQIDYDWGCVPITAYAQSDYWESFAESFTAWMGMYHGFRAHERDAVFFGSL